MTSETKFTVGEYKTRDGRDAHVVKVHGEWLFGIVEETPCSEVYVVWGLDGRDTDDDPRWDLVPPLREWWVTRGFAFPTKGEAAWNSNGQEIIHVREVRDDQA